MIAVTTLTQIIAFFLDSLCYSQDMSSYKILQTMNHDRNIVVEFVLSDGSTSVQTLHINHGETRSIDTYTADYLIAYEKGLPAQLAESRESALFDEMDLAKKIEELFAIWENKGSIQSHGPVSSSLHILYPSKGLGYTLSLSQKKEIYLLHKIIQSLQSVPGFDRLKKHLRGNPGGDDAHLLASYVYHSLVGLCEIELGHENPFDDFSFKRGDCLYLVQVKNLTLNPSIKSEEQAIVSSKIWQALESLDLARDWAPVIEGVPPPEMLDSEFNWHDFVRSHDLSKTVTIKNSNQQYPPCIISIIPGDKGRLTGINESKYLLSTISDIAKRATPHDMSKKKYALLLFTTKNVLQVVPKYASQIFEEWQNTHLDSVIFMSRQRLVSQGYKFSLLEQTRVDDTFLLSQEALTPDW